MMVLTKLQFTNIEMAYDKSVFDAGASILLFTKPKVYVSSSQLIDLLHQQIDKQTA